MSETHIYPVPAEVAERAIIDNDGYLEMYRASVDDPEAFWGEHGKRIDWIKPYSQVKDVDYSNKVHIRWFHDGTLNASANCIDRHLATRGDQAAIIWEGDDPADSKTITYRQLHEEVCRLANAMKARGIKKGDVVTIYMPMISRGRVRHAGLYAYRRDSFGGVRRLFAGRAGRPHPGLRFQLRDHRRRGRARRHAPFR